MGGVGVTLLAEARAVGLEVRADAGSLVVRGPRSREAVAHRVLAGKAEVLDALAAEDGAVAWRAVAMRRQVPPRGPIPFLAARAVDPVPGGCLSCGEPLVGGRTTRCGPCAQAAWLVLHQEREGVAE